MYRDGTLVTLAGRKEHFDGVDTLVLNEGFCGLIVQTRRMPAGQEQEYTVDFGAYGQWICRDSELSGDQLTEIHEERSIFGSFGPGELFTTADSPPVSVEVRGINPRIERQENGLMDLLFDDEIKDKSIEVDFEADLARRVAELEKEII